VRFARQAEKLAPVQAALSARYGSGRLLHRKPVLAARGTLEVLDGLPDYARHGIFAAPRVYEALARLSNAAAAAQPNAKPDIRGFAVKVLGVAGAAALGGTVESQDFLFVNQASFSARDSDEFVDVVADSRRGLPAVAFGLIRRNGLVGGLKRLKRLAATIGRPFSGFASETFDTLSPFTVGPYAARARLTPLKPAPASGKDFAADLRDRLAAGPLVYALALQFFVDEASTPIEDPTVVWPEDRARPLVVARLTLRTEEPDVERLRFDPWSGLADHRPLGEIMRARKVAYFQSQKARGAL
jgi:catalase